MLYIIQSCENNNQLYDKGGGKQKNGVWGIGKKIIDLPGGPINDP